MINDNSIKKNKIKVEPEDIARYHGNDLNGVEISYDEIKFTTQKAALLSIDGVDVWIPMSHIIRANNDVIEVTKWVYKKISA